MDKLHLLIVDDDINFVRSLKRLLTDYEIITASNEEEALRLIASPIDVALLDVRLDESDPENAGGLRVLKSIQAQSPGLPTLMVTSFGDLDLAVECMRQGASDFLQKGRVQPQEIKARLDHALAYRHLSLRVTELERDLHLIEPREIVGEDPHILRIKHLIEALAVDGNATLLLRGESGTGKDLFARALHASGPRRAYPFVAVNLSALPPTTIESELFGHEAGAYTDAGQRHIGYFEQAHRGILFLDEIGELDMMLQVKLLRFLEERQFQRLGSTKAISVDIQIVAATNANLEDRIAQGRFREDLYYRLQVHEIILPPLRNRRGDISRLVHHYIEVLRRQGKRISSISLESMSHFQSADWPGNIRQLRNSVEAAVFRAQVRGGSRIEMEDLALPISSHSQENKYSASSPTMPFHIDEELARVELSYIRQALTATHGRKAEAAQLLGYNDRFALRRRILSLFQKYPALAQNEFSELANVFSPRQE